MRYLVGYEGGCRMASAYVEARAEGEARARAMRAMGFSTVGLHDHELPAWVIPETSDDFPRDRLGRDGFSGLGQVPEERKDLIGKLQKAAT